MWPDRVSNPGPLTYESGSLPTALHGPACVSEVILHKLYPGFLLYRGTYDSAPVSDQTKKYIVSYFSHIKLTRWH